MHIFKRITSVFMVLIILITCNIIPGMHVSSYWTEYSDWSGWSAWQDTPIDETDLRDVETQQVIASTNYKTVYHYYRYASSEGASTGSYAQSASYPNKYSYSFDYELEQTSAMNGHTRYKYWYSSSNWRGLYADSPYTTQEVVSHNYKTQYRYRTRSLIYYYTVSYNANGGSGAPGNQTKTGGKTLTLSSSVPTKSFTITYNANGGSVSSANKSVSCSFNHWKASNGSTYGKGASYTSDADTTMTAQWTNPTAGTLATPTRTGYGFKGWYTASSGGSQISSSSTISSNTTIYAQWTANTYNVKYNGNGNTGGSMSNSSHTYDSAKNLTANAFTKTGYTFTGWNTKADGSGTAYANSASVKNLSSSSGATINLYAQWKANIYSIKYDGNGSTSGSMSNSSHTYDKQAALAKNTYTRTHYVFKGWNTKADGSGTSYSDAASVLNLTSSNNQTVTLYAQWTLNEYVVSFNANGGTNAPANQLKIHDQKLTITDKIPKKTYKVKFDLTVDSESAAKPDDIQSEQIVNSIFSKWNTEKDGTGKDFYPGDDYTENKELTLYARWSGASNVILPIPTRRGYVFDGWIGKYDTIDNTISGVSFDTTVNVTSPASFYGDITLRAQWKANQYVVILNSNGGYCDVEEMIVTFDSTYGQLPTPTKKGHNFIGWFTAEVGGTQISEISKVENSENVTLYAQWVAKDISAIEVNEELTKTTYYVGDTFDPDQVVLTLTYTDGEQEIISNGFTCSEPVLNKVSKKRVTVSLAGFTTYFSIDIVNPPMKNLTVKVMPEKLVYFVGDTISSEGLLLQVTYINNYFREITEGYELRYDFSTAGEKIVEVVYSEGEEIITTTFSVVVNNNPTVYSDLIEAFCGQEITIPVYISDNSGIMGFGFEVSYDESVMTPISVEASSLIKGSFDTSIATSPDSKFKIYWTGSENMNNNGLLFEMKFFVADNALGNYDVNITYIPDDTFNEQWNSVKISCKSISMNVVDSDGDVAKLYSPNMKIKMGSTFELPIKLINNNGQQNLSLTISYDTKMFKPMSVSNGIAGVTGYSIDSSAGIVNLTLNGAAEDGTLCTVKFNVEYGESGNYVFALNNTNGIKSANGIVTVADGSAKIYSNKVACVDGVVSVPVSVLGNQGLMGFKLTFEYDDKVLLPTSVNMSNLLVSGMSENTIKNADKGSFSVIWVGNDDMTEDGVLFTIEFNLIDNTVDETFISVIYSQSDTYNSKWQDVELVCDKISVSTIIKCAHSNVLIENKTESTCASNGYSGDKICQDCGKTVETGHETELIAHNYVAVVTPPTLGVQGYTTYTCSMCGHSYVSDFTDFPEIEYDAGVALEKVTGRPGETVNVYVSLDKDTDIKTMLISDIVYDSSKLVLVKGEWLAKDYIIADWNQNEETGVITFTENKTLEGNIFVLTFEIKEEAEESIVEIDCIFLITLMGENGAENGLAVEVTPGSVNIVNVIKGDVNGDGFVNSNDAILLLYHTMLPDRYEINQNCDFNGDGYVNSNDSIYLLYHTMLPERYPLG